MIRKRDIMHQAHGAINSNMTDVLQPRLRGMFAPKPSSTGNEIVLLL
jgi:hypothetical protein